MARCSSEEPVDSVTPVAVDHVDKKPTVDDTMTLTPVPFNLTDVTSMSIVRTTCTPSIRTRANFETNVSGSIRHACRRAHSDR